MEMYSIVDANGFVVMSTTRRDELVSISRDSAKMCAEDGGLSSKVINE